MESKQINTPETRLAFDNLAGRSIDEILDCFNKSFEGYFVPLQLSHAQFLQKIKTERIHQKLSAGFFEGGTLIGFILHAADLWNGEMTAYNAGTGILPAFRGAGLTSKLYDHALNHLRMNGIRKSVLEVITENEAALRTYEKVGFQVVRHLDSFRSPRIPWQTATVDIRELHLEDFESTGLCPPWQPAWQYSWNSLRRAAPDYRLFVACRADQPVAYCIVNLQNGRIAHFGCIHFEGYEAELRSLFAHLSGRAASPLSVIHIDQKAKAPIRFLRSAGFDLFLHSFEMELSF